MGDREVIVIGAGIVGLATAWALCQAQPRWRVTVLEKEAGAAAHQTGRNSGVVHSGIYYRPGSKKALTCRAGRQALLKLCEADGVPVEVCGKVIVATREAELGALQVLHERAQGNGVACALIGSDALRDLEPHAAGIAALHVPEAGIVDYLAVCDRLIRRIEAAGGAVQFNTRVLALREEAGGVVLETTAGERRATRLIGCAGLHSDRIARLGGQALDGPRIIPFRGEYFVLSDEARGLCKNLIYPVPDARFPFLGVHFTRLIGGGVECGPNAVLALAREGYSWADINLEDLGELARYSGFWSLVAAHWRMGLSEMWRSLSKAAFVAALQRLIPEVQSHHLSAAPSGVRAQAVAADGGLVDDFELRVCGHGVHVLNAPSPAATAALAIGAEIAAAMSLN